MKTSMHFGARGVLFSHAKRLRENQTFAEKLLWSRLRSNQLGVHFRRQHPLSGFIVDFYCHKLKLVIELDGSVHLEPSVQFEDNKKQQTLETMGLTVLRFTNDQVIGHIDQVVSEIVTMIEILKSESK